MEASTVGGCARSMFLCSKHMCSAFVSLLVTSLLSLFGDREDMITHLYDYTNTQKIAAPVIAVGMACTTRGTGVKHIDQLALFKFTLPSIARTTEKQFVYRVYVVHDSDDVFFEEEGADKMNGFENFTIVNCYIDSIETLFLHSSGHLRAKYQNENNQFTGQWLVP